MAGAATVAVIRRRGARKGLRRRKRSTRRGGEMLEIVSSRSFLVDVHLVNRE